MITENDAKTIIDPLMRPYAYIGGRGYRVLCSIPVMAVRIAARAGDVAWRKNASCWTWPCARASILPTPA